MPLLSRVAIIREELAKPAAPWQEIIEPAGQQSSTRCRAGFYTLADRCLTTPLQRFHMKGRLARAAS